MKKWRIIGLCALYLLSRLIFLTVQPVFFDSQELIDRLKVPQFLQSLLTGHIPLHVGYPILFWPVYQYGKVMLMMNDPRQLVIGMQILLSLATLVFFYKTLLNIFVDQKLALLSTVIAALLPVYWVSNVTFMMESTYLFFFVGSCYFWSDYVKRAQSWSLWTAGFFWMMAVLTHPLLIIWLPFLGFFPVVMCGKSIDRRKVFLVVAMLIVGFLLAGFLNAVLISLQIHSNIWGGLWYLYLSKWYEQTSFPFSLNGILIDLRNFVIPLLRNNTPIILVCALIGFWQISRKNLKMAIWFFLWIGPAFFANQIWDSLLMGRHILIAGFGIAVLAASFLKEKKVLIIVVLTYLLITSVYALSLLYRPIPYLQEQHMIEQLPPNGLLVESHFARPQTQGWYAGDMFFVNEPFSSSAQLPNKINQYINQKRPVFVSGAALSEPYGLYTGPYLQVLSLSYVHPFEVQSVLEKFALTPYKIIDTTDNLVIYQITLPQNQSPIYPQVVHENCSSRRIDYGDFVTQMWLKIVCGSPT